MGDRWGASPSSVLVVLFVALAGIDRVNLLGEGSAFTLTPAIVLTPIVVCVLVSHRIWARADGGRWRPRRSPETGVQGRWLIWLLLGLLLSLGVSTIVSPSDRAIARLVQLAVVSLGGVCSVWLARATGSLESLRIGALFGIATYVVFNIVLWLEFMHSGELVPSMGRYVNLSNIPYGADLVRLSGGSGDPNRSAMTLAIYSYVAFADPVIGRFKASKSEVAVMLATGYMVLLTFSRSGLIAYGLTLLPIWGKLRRVAEGPSLRSICAIGVLFGVAVFATVQSSASDVLGSRFQSFDDGSTTSHFRLIVRGVDDFWSGSLFERFFGRGYGTSYELVQDLFPGNPYGNFHSIWITFLVEGGLIGLSLILVILGLPVFQDRKYLAFSLIWFGMFYQSHTDASFWFGVALLWVLADVSLEGRQGGFRGGA